MKVKIGTYPKNHKKERKISVQIDGWDTWSLDHTLALIIHPALLEFKKDLSGHPATLTEEEWNDILDKMIFSFGALLNTDWEDQFSSGNIEFVRTPLNDGSGMVKIERGPNDTSAFDMEGWTAYSDRIDEGLLLFGKHFRSLWN